MLFKNLWDQGVVLKESKPGKLQKAVLFFPQMPKKKSSI